MFNNPEGWENGIGDWYPDQGIWQVGTPTKSGGAPTNELGFQAYSGSNCAVTLLNANYPAYPSSNSRLISPLFIVPAMNQYPRLRFWHWYSLGGSTGGNPDEAFVEIKAGTNNWQTISPIYNYNSGGWTYASVDLSKFAGQTVQLAFHIYAESYSSGAGWYVDDVALVTGTPVFNNPEGWENGIGDWYPDQGIWQVGTPTKNGGAPTNALGFQAHSGNNCTVTLLNVNYPAYPSSNSRLISPQFILPPASSNPYLRFWHWYSLGGSTGGNPDYAVVEIKAGTNAWQSITPLYSGNAGAWTEPFVDLTSYGGQTVQLAFHLIPGSYSSGEGWYVDDIQIYPYATSAYNPYITTTPSIGNVVLTWPTNFTGFTLQTATNLTPPITWSNVLVTPVIFNGQEVVSNSISGRQQFFRLSQ